jgi:hypothetical protein
LKTDYSRGNKAVAMIKNWYQMITRGNSFKLPLYYIFLKDTNMTILTRQERERLVLDLYNQGKTYREISKEARISPRDIGVILNKVFGEKIEEIKQDDAQKNQNQEQQQQHLSLAAQASNSFLIERFH